MFKLTKVPTVEWPVTVNIPQDGGRTVKASFSALFEVLDQEEVDQIAGANGDVLASAWKGWKAGVQDEDGRELECTPDNVARMVKIPYVRAGLWAAFAEVQNGRAAARKN